MVNSVLHLLADFITRQTGSITDKWTKAVHRNPAIESAEHLTYKQLVDPLPHLLADLAERVANEGQKRAEGEALHAEKHGQLRGQQGYQLREIIRELGLVRQIAVESLNDFTCENPQFHDTLRRKTETILHDFFTDVLAHSAEGFAEEKQRALVASEQNRQAILESALDCIIVIAEDGSVQEWNPAAESLFGYPRKETLGRELATLIIPPELRARHRAGLKHFLATGEGPVLGRRIEVPAIRADGSSLLVELAITPHRTEQKAVFTAYLRDITGRVEHERRRSAQYAIATLLSTNAPLSENGPQILKTVAGSGQWVFGALWTRSEEDKLVCHYTWRSDNSERTPFESDTIGRVFSAGEDGLPPRVFASGKPLWINDVSKESNLPRALTAQQSGIRGAFLFPLSATGKINGVIELFSDTALLPDEDLLRLVDAFGTQVGLYIERKRTEEELRRQKEAAEAANQAKDRFLATLSHELRTPLTPVLMWACATSQIENLDPVFKEGLEMVCRNVEMEARLIEDLLDVTRIERGKIELSLQPCSADTLLRHALEIVRSQLTGKSLHVSLDLAATNHRIMADPTRVEQVFWNLLKNAQKFTPDDGEIVVRSYDIGSDRLGFEISDSGPGIDAAMMTKLFTAFEQGVGSRQGLGLGLAICKAIVEMHGGEITAANRLNRTGATFSVVWKTIAAQSGEPQAVNTPSGGVPSRKLKILVVEDHAHTAAVMRNLLAQDGHDVMVASTVQEALDILHTNELDLLVSDLGLPDGNGFQVMRELAKISDAKGIAVSGYGMDDDVEKSNKAGFSIHLTKPINVHELQEAIQQVTSSK